MFCVPAISLLKDREPGAFVIRDSHSFKGAYGLAMKVASPPPTVHPNKKGRGRTVGSTKQLQMCQIFSTNTTSVFSAALLVLLEAA